MSGGLNPANLISQVALAAMTGGSSIIAQMAMQIATQVASQVIEQVGQQLGLPPAIIDMAQGAMYAAAGNAAGAAQEYGSAAGGLQSMVSDIAGQLQGSPSQQGELQREVEDIVDQLVQSATSQSENTKGSKGDSFLVALAKALGKVLDDKMTKMKDLSEEMNQTDNSDKSKLGSLGGELSAVGQEVKILSEALNNSIKSLGEAQSTLARKG